MGRYRVVHYINQFFAGIGGEEEAYTKPFTRAGYLGPGMAFQKEFGDRAEIIGTVGCGDNYFAENVTKAVAEVFELVRRFNPDFFIAGPAFNAGRYGPACGAMCQAVHERLNIPAVTGMYVENPGLELYRKEVYILETARSTAGMGEAVRSMTRLVLKLVEGKALGAPDGEGYFPRGIRKNEFVEDRAAERAVRTLLLKLKGESYVNEIPYLSVDKVSPSPPLREKGKATIALVTDGGIVPLGNPDKIEPATPTRFGKYSIAELEDLSSDQFECIHYGFDNTFASQDPDLFLPVDVMREMERKGSIKKLHPFFYSTSGCTANLKDCVRMGKMIAEDLKKEGVDGVILTSG